MKSEGSESLKGKGRRTDVEDGFVDAAFAATWPPPAIPGVLLIATFIGEASRCVLRGAVGLPCSGLPQFDLGNAFEGTGGFGPCVVGLGRGKNLACNQYELERELAREIRLRRLETHSIGFVARASTATRTVVYVFETQLIDGLEPES
jgi:hypothetical protein